MLVPLTPNSKLSNRLRTSGPIRPWDRPAQSRRPIAPWHDAVPLVKESLAAGGLVIPFKRDFRKHLSLRCPSHASVGRINWTFLIGPSLEDT